jgi:predicted nucleic acid-binding protein
MLEELAVRLARPRIRRYTRFTPEEEALFLAAIRAVAELIEIAGDVRLCRDPNDDMVIETALKGRADVLVSRNEDLTRTPELAEALAQAGIRVLTVARFLAELEGTSNCLAHQALQHALRLLVSPDGPLWEVPFAALVINPRSPVKCLGKTTPLTYTCHDLSP